MINAFPALYECTLCKGEYVHFEVDGAAGPFCPECDHNVHRRKRPRRIRPLTMEEADRLTRIIPKGLRADDI